MLRRENSCFCSVPGHGRSTGVFKVGVSYSHSCKTMWVRSGGWRRPCLLSSFARRRHTGGHFHDSFRSTELTEAHCGPGIQGGLQPVRCHTCRLPAGGYYILLPTPSSKPTVRSTTLGMQLLSGADQLILFYFETLDRHMLMVVIKYVLDF